MPNGTSILLNLLLVLFLVLLNGFFVAAEFALVKVRGSRIAQLVNEGNARAKVAQNVTQRLDAYLSACQLGITLASLGLGWVGEPAVSELIVAPLLHALNAPEYLIHPISFGVAFAVITFLHIVLGELAPKSFAIFKAELTALWLSYPLMVFYKITYPVIWVLNGAANTMLRFVGVQPVGDQQTGHTEEEIRILIKESQRSGHIDENELTLVENIFDFSERVAREVMIPRTMIDCLYTDLTFEENLDIVVKLRHTRFPVAKEHKDHIIGVIHSSDMYNAALTMPKEKQEIEPLIRHIPHIPESMEVSQVMRVMQKNRAHMVVVMDEYGGTAGMITLEDIMEEIIGDIQDEFETERPEIEVLDDRTSLDGRILIEKVNEMFGIDIEDEEVDTLGGWIYSSLNEQPKVGQKVMYDNLQFEIKKIEHLRIDRVEVNALPRTDPDL